MLLLNVKLSLLLIYGFYTSILKYQGVWLRRRRKKKRKRKKRHSCLYEGCLQWEYQHRHLRVFPFHPPLPLCDANDLHENHLQTYVSIADEVLFWNWWRQWRQWRRTKGRRRRRKRRRKKKKKNHFPRSRLPYCHCLVVARHDQNKYLRQRGCVVLKNNRIFFCLAC